MQRHVWIVIDKADGPRPIQKPLPVRARQRPRLLSRCDAGIRTLAEAERACRGLTTALDAQHRAGWAEAIATPRESADVIDRAGGPRPIQKPLPVRARQRPGLLSSLRRRYPHAGGSRTGMPPSNYGARCAAPSWLGGGDRHPA